MSHGVIIRRRAETQIHEAFIWYEAQRKGLGDDFLLCLESSLNRTQDNPGIFQKKYKNIRMVMISRFPYGIFYFTDNEKIVVIAVFHLSRNPRHWIK